MAHLVRRTGLHPPSCNSIGQIGRITTSGAVTEYNVPEPDDITVGPDGALWFTDLSGIGRITTAGVVTQYPVPAGTGPKGIVTGPDGALWFGDNGTDAIGRMTTSGTITEYPFPAGCPAVKDIAITPGPDGALWFTLGRPVGSARPRPRSGASRHPGKFTESSIPTSYAAPTGSPRVQTARCGSPRVNGNKIGRITTSGTVTEYPVPTPNSGLGGIAAGPDGALWFTEPNARQDRAHHHSRHDHRVPLPRLMLPGRHHRRPRRRAMVHRDWYQ